MIDKAEYQREYMVAVGERPWGRYEVLANEEDHKVKRVTVQPGHRLSLQRHKLRDEHWFVHKGTARVTLGDDEIVLGKNEYIDIPRMAVHRIENIGEGPMVFIEVQTGEYFGEDDIERLEDDYVRSTDNLISPSPLPST